MRSSWIAALGLSVASAATVHAQDALDTAPTTTLSDEPEQPQLTPGEADRKARSLFQQGRQAFENGRFRDAWDYFRQGYLLSKRPELLYNVGQAADRMRMDREALDAFRLYLERLPDAANRREVENRVRALEERLGEAPQEPNTANAANSDATLPDERVGGEQGASAAPSAELPTNGQPRRSGWYVRLALGLGVLHDSVSKLASPVSLTSATLASHIGVGYDVAQGFVVGGALVFDWALAPHINGTAVDIKTANLSLLMAFVDYYFAPREDGWHLLGGLGFGSYSLSDSSATIGSENAGGIGFMAGGGYEWPLSREWALGALGRIVLATMNQDTGHHIVFAPSLAFTAAWY